MRIRWRALLVSGVLAVSIALPWLRSDEAPRPIVAPDPGPGPTAFTAPPMPPLASLTETAARPLFSASRRPPAPATQAKPAPVAAKPTRLVGYRLTGIVRSSSHRLILLTEEKSGRVVELREGDLVDGWRLISIGAEQIRLTRDGIEIDLLQLGPTAPVTRGRNTRWLPSSGDQR